ncbi:MAG: hypothetical protein JWM34_709 [Ilumatobacteraceae bacterium]|nr:hypothetical protein [Ilumatobacteraceae bacterium]
MTDEHDPRDDPDELDDGLDDGLGDGLDDGLDDEEGVVLRASSSRWVWSLIGSLVFLTFGAALTFSVHTGAVAKIIGGIIFATFAFCAFVAVRELAAPGSLVVTRTSVDMLTMRRHTSFALTDCSEFTTWRNPSRGTTSVVFDYAPDGDTELARENRRLMGGSRSIPDTFGVPAADLARLLNEAWAASRRDAE